MRISVETVEPVGEREHKLFSTLFDYAIHHRYIQKSIMKPAADQAPLMYLKRGLVSITAITPEGRRKIMGIARPGAIFGLPLFSQGYLESNQLQLQFRAEEQSDVFSWDTKRLLHRIQRESPLGYLIIRDLLGKVALLTTQVCSLSYMTGQQRTAAVLSDLAASCGKPTPDGILLDLYLTQETIAQMTGLSRVTISSVLKTLGLEGFLKANGQGSYLLLAPEAIAATF